MQRSIDDISRTAASVLERIKSTARNKGEDAQTLILRYVLQRWLHRLSANPVGEGFVVKGGMMMPLLGAGARPTEDIDGHFDRELDEAAAAAFLVSVCATDPLQEDGVLFDPSSVRLDPIRDGIMPGFRGSVTARMHPAGGRPTEMRIKVDLCFGDIITPSPVVAELPPAIKGFDPVRVTVYPWPTVLAEKLHALARHGAGTTRMKDLYDIVLVIRSVEIDGTELSGAIANTFDQWGKTPPAAALEAVAGDFPERKAREWAAFMKRKGANTLDVPSLGAVAEEIREFATPAIEAAAAGLDLDAGWRPGDGWCHPAPLPGVSRL